MLKCTEIRWTLSIFNIIYSKYPKSGYLDFGDGYHIRKSHGYIRIFGYPDTITSSKHGCTDQTFLYSTFNTTIIQVSCIYWANIFLGNFFIFPHITILLHISVKLRFITCTVVQGVQKRNLPIYLKHHKKGYISLPHPVC